MATYDNVQYNDSSRTYNDSLLGYGGFDVAPSLHYSVVLRDFKDAASEDFSPGAVIAFIDNPTNLAYTEYVNEVGEAFFTISQEDAKAAKIADLEDLVNRRVHMEVRRNGEQVWGGWLGEIDETTSDAVLYGYSYASGFYDLLTEWDQSWTGKTVRQIVLDVVAAAKAKDFSRVAWFRTGNVESPVTTSGGSTAITLPLYRAPFKRILSVLREMAAYSISDTTNHVIFEVTPSGEFNLWKNRKETVSNVHASFGHWSVRSYRRIRRLIARRTKLYSVGTSPTSVNLQDTFTNTTQRALMGLSEEPIYLAFVRDSDELSRVTKMRGERAGRVDSDLYLTFYKDSIIPFRATGATYKLGDVINPELEHGTSFVSEEDKVVTGQQVVYVGKRENVRLLLGDRL